MRRLGVNTRTQAMSRRQETVVCRKQFFGTSCARGNAMNTTAEIPVHTVQPFAPAPDEAYPIDTIAHLADVPRHVVLLCCRHRVIEPQVDPEYGGYRFPAAA